MDLMVDCELEAAEALAGLACSAASDLSPVLSRDQETMTNQHKIENLLPNVLGPENECEININPSGTCTFDYPSVTTGNKSRQILTEAEKEARRLRRVLANRESARQTIRRRQAMYDELMKKAADLALENENLKREKELAAKEYDCLKTKNNSLKAQMTRVVKEEVKDIHVVPNLNEAEPSDSIPPAPNFFYSHFPMMQVGENTPLYVLPFPWVIPIQAPTPYLPQSANEYETAVTQQCSKSSSKTRVSLEQPHIFLPVKDESEDSSSTQGIQHKDDSKEVGFGFLLTDLQASPFASVGQVTSVGQMNRDTYEDKPMLSCSAKNSADTIAAMEARKRRKETMKLKSLHCRPSYHVH